MGKDVNEFALNSVILEVKFVQTIPKSAIRERIFHTESWEFLELNGNYNEPRNT